MTIRTVIWYLYKYTSMKWVELSKWMIKDFFLWTHQNSMYLQIQTTLQQAHPNNRVRVYLPRLPLSLLGSDPDCSLAIYPVR